MFKKIMKILFVIVVIFVLVLAGLALWHLDTISIFTSNQDTHGTVETTPEVKTIDFPPITMGQTDWICWRGPEGDGYSSMTGIINDWSTGLEKMWEIGFLCQGEASADWSAPVVQGNRLIVCGREDSSDVVYCLNPQNGSLIWKKSYPTEAGSSYGTGFRATPWIDKDRVYTFGRSGDVICWNLLDGDMQWHQNVTDEGGEEPTWGYSTSPLVTEELIVVNGGGSARTIAYDKISGNLKWKIGTGPAGYAALTSLMLEGTQVILSFHGKGLAAISSQDGKELWNTVWETDYDVNATTPIIIGDQVFITSGYGTGCQLLKVSKSEAKVLWKNTALASHHSDPILIDGHIYGYSGESVQNRGSFKCIELKTGNEKWSTNEMGWGTCTFVDGYILCCDIKGNLFLMQPDPNNFVLKTKMSRVLGKIKGAFWTRPVLANDKLYLRFKQKLACFNITN